MEPFRNTNAALQEVKSSLSSSQAEIFKILAGEEHVRNGSGPLEDQIASTERAIARTEKTSSEATEDRRSTTSDPVSPPPSAAVVDASDARQKWRETMVKIALVYLIPFTYSASIKLTGIYFVIELVDRFKVGYSIVGAFLAASYVARVATISACMYAPRVASFVGTGLGLLGYLAVTLSSTEGVFVAGSVLAGSTEIFSALQIFTKDYFSDDLNEMGKMLKVQFTMVNVASVLVFFVGGVMYDRLEHIGIAALGVGLLGLQLLFLALFFVAEGTPNSQRKTDAARKMEEDTMEVADVEAGTSGHDENTPKSNSSEGKRETLRKTRSQMMGEYQAQKLTPQVSESLRQMAASQSKRNNERSEKIAEQITQVLNRHGDSEELPITWMNYLIAMSTCTSALVKGFVFSLSWLLMYNEFGINKSIIGVISGVGAISSVVASYLTVNELFLDLMKRKLPSPRNFYMCLLGLTFMVALTAVPVFGAYVVGVSLLNIFLSMFTSFATELQGKISTRKNYKTLGPLGQLSRRICNVAVSFVAPVLFGVFPFLPNIVAAVCCGMFLVVLVICFRLQKQKVREILAKELRGGDHSEHVCVATAVGESRRLSFAETIILTRMLGQERNPCFAEDV